MLDKTFVSILKDAAYDIRVLHKQLEVVKNEVENIQYEKQKLSNRIVDLKRLEQSQKLPVVTYIYGNKQKSRK